MSRDPLEEKEYADSLRPVKHALFDIWEDNSGLGARWGGLSWRVQLVGYAAHFASKEDAERYIASVKKQREKK
jgi:hypothetical protein